MFYTRYHQLSPIGYLPMQYVRKSELIPMNINYIERYLRSYLQRFYNTFGTNDAKLPERAIFMPHFPMHYPYSADCVLLELL